MVLISGDFIVEFMREFRGRHLKGDLDGFARKVRCKKDELEYCVIMFMADNWSACEAKDDRFPLPEPIDGWTKLKRVLREEERARKKEKPTSVKHSRMGKMQLGASPDVSLAAVMMEQGCICPCCRRDLILVGDYHLDHILPLFLGGSNDYWNLQFLCGRCNLKKRAKEPIAWSKQTGSPLPGKFLSVYIKTE